MLSLQQQELAPFQTVVHPPPNKYVGAFIVDYSCIVGQGNFSTVYIAINTKEPNKRYAAKVIDLWKMRQDRLEGLVMAEIEVLLAIDHYNILKCRDVFEDGHWCYIITELCENGNL